MNANVWPVQPETQPKRLADVIDSVDAGHSQREIPLLAALAQAKWVPDEEVSKWHTYRDAVVWCWDNQRHYIGVREQARQAMFANAAGLHAPHACRCLKADSKAPMDLPDRAINAFESFTGWRGLRQWQMRQAGLTCMEQVIDQRRAA